MAGLQVEATPAPADGNQPAPEATLDQLLQQAHTQLREISWYSVILKDFSIDPMRVWDPVQNLTSPLTEWRDRAGQDIDDLFRCATAACS